MKQGGDAIGLAGVMQVICNCGNPKPLLVPFSTDGGMSLTCGMCGTDFSVAQITYDIRKPNELRLGVGFKVRAIQPGTLEDLRAIEQRIKPS